MKKIKLTRSLIIIYSLLFLISALILFVTFKYIIPLHKEGESITDLFSKEKVRQKINLENTEVNWKEGKVEVFDYSSFPGSYNTQVEWTNGSDTKVLFKAGDDIPEIKVVDGKLQIVVFANKGVNNEKKTFVIESLP